MKTRNVVEESRTKLNADLVGHLELLKLLRTDSALLD
jgi:hypothetical protein